MMPLYQDTNFELFLTPVCLIPRPYTIAISHTTSNVLKQNITSAIINSRALSSVPLEHNHEQTNSKIAV